MQKRGEERDDDITYKVGDILLSYAYQRPKTLYPWNTSANKMRGWGGLHPHEMESRSRGDEIS